MLNQMIAVIAKADTQMWWYLLRIKVVNTQDEVPAAFIDAINKVAANTIVAEAFKEIVNNVEITAEETVNQCINDGENKWNTEIAFNKFWMLDDVEMESLHIEAVPVYELIWRGFYSM